jgi:hypothetical protein
MFKVTTKATYKDTSVVKHETVNVRVENLSAVVKHDILTSIVETIDGVDLKSIQILVTLQRWKRKTK